MAHILVIDDEEQLRKVMEALLTNKGHKVFLAENGEKGLAVFKRVRPAITILDLRMPGLDGLEVLRRLREMDAQAYVTIFTGYGTEEEEAKARALGANDFLRKDFTGYDLSDMIRRSIDRLIRVPRDWALNPQAERGAGNGVSQTLALQRRDSSSNTVSSHTAEADPAAGASSEGLLKIPMDDQSKTEICQADRRATPRFRAQFRTTFSMAAKMEGVGIIQDLSLGGCRVESAVFMTPGVSVELRLYAPDLEWPVMVEVAIVKWARPGTFGLSFSLITQSEQQRLQQVLMKLGDSQRAA